ncbi:hypothetical protein Q5752_003096 [Cryptotrichosporon argae]
MSSFHPTRRDCLLVLTLTALFGLFLQLDRSVVDAARADSLLGLGLGFGGAGAGSRQTYDQLRDKGADDWLDDVEVGAKHASAATHAMADAKAHWGDEGALRTEVLAHAPGWTIFDSVYLFNGTWFIVTDSPSSIPLLRLMVSTGNEIWNDEASIRGREPTEKDMRIIFPSEAKRLWGNSASRVTGTSMLVNDPPQFLDHYYHFAAELLFGLWRTYASLDPTITPAGQTHLPAPSRMIFPHVSAGKWNDYAKMNSFLSRAIFPSMSYEYQNDFLDRADTARAFVFDRVVFADRAAAFRGAEFQRTWRTAAEAVALPASRYWWAPVRRNLVDFVGGTGQSEYEAAAPLGLGAAAGVGVGVEHDLATDDDVALEEEEAIAVANQARAEDTDKAVPVITYVSRQDWGRRMLRTADHNELVRELHELEKKYGWEVNIVSMDQLSRDEQIRLAARTTIMMGVHGNGLTHLLWMNNQNPRATVIEFFYPGGFAADYEFTANALGMRHYGVWNDETFTAPDTPQVAYPDGFQGNDIPLSGKAVARLVVERLAVDNVHRDVTDDTDA